MGVIYSMQTPLNILILAAGLGTRMKSRKAKVLHQVAGKALVEHVTDTALRLTSADRITVVVGHQAERVRELLGARGVRFALQAEQKGTGHAVLCCEGAVLLVDAFQGVEAQTVANAYAALNHELVIVPVINKIDLTMARVDEVKEEMEHTLAIDRDEVIGCSAKTGLNCEAVLAAVIERVPPPKGEPDGVLQAMVFDSVYDEFRGAVTYVRVMNGGRRKWAD